MAFKVSSSKLIKAAKLADRAATAINTLERLGSNKYVFIDLRKELQDFRDELISQYDLKSFDEWKNGITKKTPAKEVK